jgi:serine/threonine protein kinase
MHGPLKKILGDHTDSAGEHDYPTCSNLLRVQTKSDVFKKYEILQEFGSGSMGKVMAARDASRGKYTYRNCLSHLITCPQVCKVRIRGDKLGGSAYHPKPRGLMGKLKQSLHIKDKAIAKVDIPSIRREYLYALKSIIIDRVSPEFVDELKNEINILRCLDHPNIVKAHEVFLCKDKQIYIVLELCDGGDLYTRSPYTERHAARIVTKLLSAVT